MRTALLSLLLLCGCATARASESVSPAVAGSIPVDKFSAEDLSPVQKKFDERVAAGDRDIMFTIDSGGGEIGAGMALIEHINQAKKRNGVRVSCVVDWQAYSMAFIFLQGACDERLMRHNSMVMTHSGATGAQGHADEIADTLARLNALNDMIADMVSHRMGMPKAAYLERVAHNEWWMSAEQAIDAHAADAYVDDSALPLPYVLDPVENDLDGLLRKLLGA